MEYLNTKRKLNHRLQNDVWRFVVAYGFNCNTRSIQSVNWRNFLLKKKCKATERQSERLASSKFTFRNFRIECKVWWQHSRKSSSISIPAHATRVTFLFLSVLLCFLRLKSHITDRTFQFAINRQKCFFFANFAFLTTHSLKSMSKFRLNISIKQMSAHGELSIDDWVIV